MYTSMQSGAYEGKECITCIEYSGSIEKQSTVYSRKFLHGANLHCLMDGPNYGENKNCKCLNGRKDDVLCECGVHVASATLVLGMWPTVALPFTTAMADGSAVLKGSHKLFIDNNTPDVSVDMIASDHRIHSNFSSHRYFLVIWAW